MRLCIYLKKTVGSLPKFNVMFCIYALVLPLQVEENLIYFVGYQLQSNRFVIHTKRGFLEGSLFNTFALQRYCHFKKNFILCHTYFRSMKIAKYINNGSWSFSYQTTFKSLILVNYRFFL